MEKKMHSVAFVLNFARIAWIGLVLSGCSSAGSGEGGAFQGSGTDRLPESPCNACSREPFYKQGRWL